MQQLLDLSYLEEIVENNIIRSDIRNKVYDHKDNRYKEMDMFGFRTISARLYFDLCILVTQILRDLALLNQENVTDIFLNSTNLPKELIGMILEDLGLNRKQYEQMDMHGYIERRHACSNIYQFILDGVYKYINLSCILHEEQYLILLENQFTTEIIVTMVMDLIKSELTVINILQK